MSNIFKLNILPEDRILVVSPHPDDESFGCGGLLLLYGPQIDILSVTDGRKSHVKGITDDECAEQRKKELAAALAYTGVRRVISMEYRDLEAYCAGKSIQKFDFSPYSKIFIPNRAEEHADHRAINEYVRRRLFLTQRKQVFEYEVWAPLPYPNYYLDISSIIEKKREMISSFPSQLLLRDYHAMILGLNAYRGVVCHTKYAEAYELLSTKNKCKKLLYRLPIQMQRRIMAVVGMLKNKKDN